MNNFRSRIPLAFLALILTFSVWGADSSPQSTAPAAASSAEPSHQDWDESDRRERAEPGDDKEDAEEGDHSNRHDPEHSRERRHDRDDRDDVVNIGSDSVVAKDQHADAVVSVLGSSTIEGDAETAVSVLGNTRIEGKVAENAVAVLGNTYVNNAVGGDVISVLGNVELGPNAVVGHDVTAVGGKIKRDPAAHIGGGVKNIGGNLPAFEGLQAWIQNCLLYGRPLAFASGLTWAWGLALTFLVLYLCIALLFRDGVERCVRTLESKPGPCVLAALLTMLLVPVLFVLLCITLVGVAAIPFIVVGLFGASLFGKAVMLAWIGKRCLGARREGTLAHPAAAVLIGGAIVLVLYVVPILGFVLYKVLGVLGLGAVVYTFFGTIRERREAAAPAKPGIAAAAAGSAFVSAAAAPVSDAASGAAPSAAPSAAPEAAPAAAAQAAGPHVAPSAAAPSAPEVTASLPRGGFWIRMVALLLDVLLIGIVMGMMHHAFHLELLVLAAYGAIMWKLRGATIGGIVFDLQVVRLDGRAVNWETAIVRGFGCFLSLAIAGLGFFWIAFDHEKQAWHDKIAGTVVVRVPKGVSLV